MSCCKKFGCKNTNPQQLPTEEMRAANTITTAREIVIKLLDIAHLNNKILPGDISPLRLANLIDDLINVKNKPAQPATTQTTQQDFVLKFGPGKAYELYLPAGSSLAPTPKDPQTTFNFEAM